MHGETVKFSVVVVCNTRKSCRCKIETRDVEFQDMLCPPPPFRQRNTCRHIKTVFYMSASQHTLYEPPELLQFAPSPPLFVCIIIF
jgi:hypothetical protein